MFDPPEPEAFDMTGGVPLLTPAGSLVLLHHALVHWSNVNDSPHSRFAYSIHVVDGQAEWPADNWLQRADGKPFPPLAVEVTASGGAALAGL